MKTAQPWIDNPFKLISWENMLKFSAHLYLNIGASLNWMNTALADIADAKKDHSVRETIKATGERLMAELQSISCRYSVEAARRFVRDAKNLSQEGLKLRATELREAIFAEMQDQLFLWVPPDRAKFYNGTEETFGPEVADNFSSCLSEIREAGNCYATGHFTACVFHLMRVMEGGLSAAFFKLGLPFSTNLSWEKILRMWGKDEIEGNPEANVKMMNDLEFFQNLRASVASVKDAVRNPTMHFDRTYSETEALEIMTAVRGFMRLAATKLDDMPF